MVKNAWAKYCKKKHTTTDRKAPGIVGGTEYRDIWGGGGLTWSHLVLLWTHLGSPGLTWTLSGTLGLIWIQSYALGLTWTDLDSP